MKRLAMSGVMTAGLALFLALGLAIGVKAQTPTVSLSPASLKGGIMMNSREVKSWGWNFRVMDLNVNKISDGTISHFTIGGGCIHQSTVSGAYPVVINEIHIGPDGNWVEIFNRSCGTESLNSRGLRWQYSLDGFTWMEDAFGLPRDYVAPYSIAGGGYVRFMEGTGTDTDTILYTGKTFNWTNAAGGRVELITTPVSYTSVTTYDSVCWGGNLDCSYSLATPGPTQSLGRNGYGTDLNLEQDFHYYSPTPGAINDPSQTSQPWVHYQDSHNSIYGGWPITWLSGDGAIWTGVVTVGLDANNLPDGTYTTVLSVFTDIPGYYQMPLPVEFTVGYPDFSVSTPSPLEVTLVPGDIATRTVNIKNNAPLVAGRYWIDGGFSQNYDLRINEVFMGDYTGAAQSTWVELYNASDHTLSGSLEIMGQIGTAVDHQYCPINGIQPGAFMRIIDKYKGPVSATEIYCRGFYYVRPDRPSFLTLGKDNDAVYFGGNGIGNPDITSATFPEQWIMTQGTMPKIPLYQSLARDADKTDFDRDTDWTFTTEPTPGAPNGTPTYTPAPWLTYNPGSAKLNGGANSAVSVKFNAYGLEPGDYQTQLRIRSWDPNHPLITLPVTLHVQVGAIMNVASEFMDDDNFGASLGNGNMIVEPNETIEMGVVLKNSGALPAWYASATLSTDDPYVVILSDTQEFGIIPAYNSRLSLGDYVFAVDPSTPSDHIVLFNLQVTTLNGEVWNLPITVTVSVDSDYDGMPDYWEQQYIACGLDELTPDQDDDPDIDGLANLDEYLAGTDPCNPDTDDDCILDGLDDALTPGIGCERMVAPAGNWTLRVTLLDASASLDSDIYLYSPQEELLIEHSLQNVGAVSTMSIAGGQDLSLYIRVNGEPIGLGTYDHFSNSIFAEVTDEGYGAWIIGFEDLPTGQADWDYNDVVVLVELLPATKHNGVTVNYLGEIELSTDEGDELQLLANLADPQGFATSVAVPRAALSGPASIILTNGNPDLYQGLMLNSPFIPVSVRKVLLTNGQVQISEATAQIAIGYQDRDQNGFVDGSGIIEGSLAFYRYDAHDQTWVKLPTTVNPAQNQVTAPTSHFSLFALGVDPNYTAPGSGGGGNKSANDGNWFGCALTTGAAPTAGLGNLIPMFLFAAIPAIALRLRRRGNKK